MVLKMYETQLYEYEHFERYYEDVRHGLMGIELYRDMEEWLIENKIDHDINCDDFYNDHDCGFIIIEFKNQQDLIHFKLRWI